MVPRKLSALFKETFYSNPFCHCPAVFACSLVSFNTLAHTGYHPWGRWPCLRQFCPGLLLWSFQCADLPDVLPNPSYSFRVPRGQKSFGATNSQSLQTYISESWMRKVKMNGCGYTRSPAWCRNVIWSSRSNLSRSLPDFQNMLF